MFTRQLEGLRALVVEDEYFLADDLKRLLIANGAERIHLSGTLEDAVSRIRHDGFEVALIDIKLRDDLAFPIADELVRRCTPFGFVTGYDRAIIPERFRRVPCWPKPFDRAEVVAGIAQLRAGFPPRSR